ncbi:MAG TPA: hypothetical protein VGJ16_12830 [Pirellulales bacterium]|jgi:hypothetical protein
MRAARLLLAPLRLSACEIVMTTVVVVMMIGWRLDRRAQDELLSRVPAENLKLKAARDALLAPEIERVLKEYGFDREIEEDERSIAKMNELNRQRGEELRNRSHDDAPIPGEL